jgi:hypothetical protein|tara:strand:- start:720 stop:944 length:225 start_codon:yes stop_codon:yes gene_type:complete
MAIEQTTQPEMLRQFRERFSALVEENKKLAERIKENEVTALKLQGAIETLEYYNPETMSAPPDEEVVDEVETAE